MAAYDAFVSYSHAKDKPVAAALQSVMQRLGKPWYRRRALRLFRDDTSLSATPSLWPSIEQALGNSRFLIVLASPEAAASHWVNKEVSWWLDNKSADTLLIALTDGELAWNSLVNDFAASDATPLPPVLTGRFTNEPKWIDLRAHRDGTNARDARFIEAGADFAAAIHGVAKEDLLSQEVRQQRRALRLAWGAASSLLILAGLAGWQAKVALDNERAAIEQRNIADQQRQFAQQQRDRAERSLAAATKTANSLVHDLAREFRDRAGMPAALVHRILERAQALQLQLAESGESSPELWHSQGVALMELVDTLLALGDTKGALAAAERARAILGKLAASDPGTLEWHGDVSASVAQLGDVRLAGGDRSGALAAYEESLSIMQKLTASDPANAAWQRDMSVSLDRVADMRWAAGDRVGALAAYQQSLAIRRKLAVSDPINAEWQRDLSVSLNRLGDQRAAARDHAGALAAYEESLAIRRKLVASDPINTGLQSDVSVGLEKLGDARMVAGDRVGALAAYEEGLTIRLKLVASDPGNARWQRDVSVSLNKVGDVRLAMHDRSGALTVYEESLAIRRKLAASDPSNAERHRDLAVSLYKISNASDSARSSLALREALAILEALAHDNKPLAAEDNLLQLVRDALAKVSAEAAGAQ